MRQITLSQQPEIVEVLRNGQTRVYYEVTPETETIAHRDEEAEEVTETTHEIFRCKAVDLPEFTYEKLIDALIRERFSISDELAILRQRDSKPEDFQAYNTYAEECKTIAKRIFGKDEE